MENEKEHDKVGSTNNAPSPPLPFKLLEDGSGIQIAGWTILRTEKPIANTAAEEKLTDELNIKLPSMLFDQSNLTLSLSKFQLSFDTINALRMVGKADPQIKVQAAARWTSKKKRSDVEITTLQHASDWTFSTKYKGTLTSTKTTNDNNNVEYKIDYDALRDTTLPILFSSQVILFEDELDDNGTASYKVRIRVMPTFFFILTRFFLRVDSVIVRIYDTRYFHRFGCPAIVCETIHREASIPKSLQHLHVSILRDPDMLAPKLPTTFTSLNNIFINNESST